MGTIVSVAVSSPTTLAFMDVEVLGRGLLLSLPRQTWRRQ